jgi:hypothetical protein
MDREAIDQLEQTAQASFAEIGFPDAVSAFGVGIGWTATLDQWLTVYPDSQVLSDALRRDLPRRYRHEIHRERSLSPHDFEVPAATAAEELHELLEPRGEDEEGLLLKLIKEIADASIGDLKRVTWVTLLSTANESTVVGGLVVDNLAVAASPTFPWGFSHPVWFTGHWRSCPFPCSLAGAVVAAILQNSSMGITSPWYATDNLAVGPTPSELVRTGARALLESAVREAVSDKRHTPVWNGNRHAMFDTCNSLAELTHERASLHGELVVAPWTPDDSAVLIKFVAPILLEQTRRIRKLLEMTGDGIALVINDRVAMGLAQGYENIAASHRGVLTIKFLGDSAWEVVQRKKVLFRVRRGRPAVVRTRFDERQLSAVMPSSAYEELLRQIVKRAESAPHGTTIVMTHYAAAETLRLQREGTPVVPVHPSTEMAGALMSIDGALMLDFDGQCHAAGVILDGSATTRGDPSRGSRYNSAVRYLDSIQDPDAVVCVFSEDGAVDILTKADSASQFVPR